MHSIRPSAIQMKRFEKREIQETEVLPRQTIIFCDNNDFCVKTQRGKGKGVGVGRDLIIPFLPMLGCYGIKIYYNLYNIICVVSQDILLPSALPVLISVELNAFNFVVLFRCDS